VDVCGDVCVMCVCGGDASYGTNGTKAMAPKCYSTLTVEKVVLRFASNFVSILNGANSIPQCSLNDRRLQVVQIQSHIFYFSQKSKLFT
jgi:hypothetical protein